MFRIFSDWFGMGINIPIIVTDLALFALGLIPSLKIGKKKTVIYIMLTLVALYLIASALRYCGIAIIVPYAIYLGAICILGFAGMGIGLLARLIKEKK